MTFKKLVSFLCMVVHAAAQHSGNISDRVVTYDGA